MSDLWVVAGSSDTCTLAQLSRMSAVSSPIPADPQQIRDLIQVRVRVRGDERAG